MLIFLSENQPLHKNRLTTPSLYSYRLMGWLKEIQDKVKKGKENVCWLCFPSVSTSASWKYCLTTVSSNSFSLSRVHQQHISSPEEWSNIHTCEATFIKICLPSSETENDIIGWSSWILHKRKKIPSMEKRQSHTRRATPVWLFQPCRFSPGFPSFFCSNTGGRSIKNWQNYPG